MKDRMILGVLSAGLASPIDLHWRVFGPDKSGLEVLCRSDGTELARVWTETANESGQFVFRVRGRIVSAAAAHVSDILPA